MPPSEDGESNLPAGRQRSHRRSKVGRVIQDYGLDGLGEELEARWLGERDGRFSLRNLADHFNVTLLREVMETAGMQPLEGEVENMYRLLTDDDVTRGVRVQVENRFKHEDIDVEELESDFVSHQAIHTYLTKYRGVDFSDGSASRSATDHVEQRAESIHRLVSRTTAVTERILTDLDSTDRITLGDFHVLVDVRVHCEGCGKQYNVGNLLERGGCECEP